MIGHADNFASAIAASSRRRAVVRVLSFAICILCFLIPARAQYREDLPDTGKPTAPPPPTIVDKSNAQVPLDLNFTSSDGTTAALGTWFHHGRPVILSLVYFSCPFLCGVTQDNLCAAVREGPSGLVIGKDYDIVVVSIDPDDKPKEAALTRKNYLAKIPLPESQAGFTYLTGSESNIKDLADAVGFGYRVNPVGSPASNGKIAHASGIFICTPEGRLSKTIAKIDYTSDELHNALRLASNGKIDGGLLGVAIFCGACYVDASGNVKVNPWFFAGTAGGVITILVMITFFTILFRGDAKRNKAHPATTPPAATT